MRRPLPARRRIVGVATVARLATLAALVAPAACERRVAAGAPDDRAAPVPSGTPADSTPGPPAGTTLGTPPAGQLQGWCAQPRRSGHESFATLAVADPWFLAYAVAPGVVALYEPYNFQEVISYLVQGERQALLFDTGMGMGRLGAVVRALTDRPVSVLNSHTHHDHVGGNAEFATILGMDTDYTRQRARGIPHAEVAREVTPAALCAARLAAPFDTAAYRIHPFVITRTVRDGDVIDLGGRQLEVVHVPGHAPDALALLDRAHGHLYTGDTFYEGPIWLFSPGTDTAAYARSLDRLATLAPSLQAVFPGHNTPRAQPARLVQLRDAFRQLQRGAVSPARTAGETREYVVDGFTFVLRAPSTGSPPRP
jgi:glyoxylase-like metal-dependent hydrolase (beta-lactamase superfamily II)